MITAPSNRQNVVDSGLVSARQWSRDSDLDIDNGLSFDNMDS